ncbi:putative 2-keto-myo-inositol dehydratase [metagenome]|uniref:Putative 2-keto-myo-inositol dehydratase n=1 Tax=metagenome TaxID=256318 RepID=A0A2P2CFU4_9ZZZZ
MTTAGPLSFTERIAAAPISWGVCEVPDWGFQLDPARVLGEMRSLGLTATEFGPDGFLANEPEAKAAQLRELGMTAVGGFLPILLHDPGHDPLPEVDAFIDGCLAADAGVVVLAAFSGADGYDARPVLDDLGWSTMLGNLDRIAAHAESRGVIATLHPHVGTMVEQSDEIDRVLAGSVVGLCVDTGHMLVGGADPVAVVKAYAGRVTHVHLKDVDAAMAEAVLSGELSFTDAVRDGIFRPLGDGDIDIATLVRLLEDNGYQGWYVLEQDLMLDGEPEGAGPIENVRRCLAFLNQAVA